MDFPNDAPGRGISHVMLATSSLMPANPRAVFLSYASQDAAVAKKISAAFCAAGIVVWLDQSELRGGDAWDENIQQQISLCTLFVPIISTRSQGRREGYFRLEWRLAEERMRRMATGTPFLLPVTVDEISEREALVPPAFRAVHWAHLPQAEVTSEFVHLVKQLLDQGTLRGETLMHVPTDTMRFESPKVAPAEPALRRPGSRPASGYRSTPVKARSRLAWWLLAAGLVAVAVVSARWLLHA
jgi:TIR domain